LSRYSKLRRETKETLVEVEINLDGQGRVKVETPVPFLNHMLESMLFYMRADATILAKDYKPFDDHHVVEDVAITLGQAVKEALGDKRGIARFADRTVPMDEALVQVAVDVSGRGMAFVEWKINRDSVGGLAIENAKHFIQSFAYNSGITIHVIQLRGENSHHILEASFKALGLALRDAFRVESAEIPSTKGSL
jgi:imidazoleglycerol-phosphate dehydratase